MTGQVGTLPFVVQNLRNKVTALHNVCSHRSSPLQTSDRGNRGLYCPYHGWTYDSEGMPVGIPHNEDYYPISKEEAACIALRTFRLETLGAFVFVCGRAGSALSEHLGSSHALLSRIGSALDDVYFQSRIQVSCNWKFLIHNAYDDIHAQFVHPSTSLDTSDAVSAHWTSEPFDNVLERIPDDCSRRHALFTVELTEAAQRRNAAACDGAFSNRQYSFDQYLHLMIFPNLLITSVQGLWYNIVHFRPTSPDSCEITYWLVPGRQRGGRSTCTPDMLYHLALGSLQIFQEDIAAVESSQRSVASTQRLAVLGRREDKIDAFDAAYMNAMSRAGLR